jgi:hypothetical protein
MRAEAARQAHAVGAERSAAEAQQERAIGLWKRQPKIGFRACDPRLGLGTSKACQMAVLLY